jgi:membrane protein implicated in regulation of membrane protease activity
VLWWQWIVLGIVLLGAEMVVDAQFFLVFLGVSAVAVGGIDVLWPGSPMWAEWLLFSAIAIASFVLFRAKLYDKIRGDSPDLSGELVGEIGTIEADIAPGGTGRIILRGTTWSARNVGDGVLPKYGQARVGAISGVTVDVQSTDS